MSIRAVAPKAEHSARITKALLKLSSARREKLSEIDFEVFVDGLREFDALTVERVCDELGRVAPQEFQPKFPPLFQIRELCHRSVEARKVASAAGLLCAAALDERFPPLPPDKFEEIKARFREVLGKKAMPPAAAGERD